ncbi:transposase [Methylocystis rosea]|uniref:Transposase n=1 Tax=Methylocystis rosea TaxID=173366 RepID=A0A3G8LZZ2_9HYPH|nr:transposase [Methylocystis rosea]
MPGRWGERGQFRPRDRYVRGSPRSPSDGFEGVVAKETGRPSYHPSTLLKLYIYGYLNRVQSSRRLERESARNIEVMWLIGRLVPDHKTIADFRKDNGAAIRKVCARFVALCWNMSLLQNTGVAIDGSNSRQ